MNQPRHRTSLPLRRHLGLVATAGWLLLPAAWAQQGNLVKVQYQSQVLDVTRSSGQGGVSQDDGVRASRSVQQAIRQRGQEQQRLAGQARQRAQQALQAAPLAEATQATATSGATASAATVDERPLWNLLRRKDLRGFDQQLARLRGQGGWMPSAQLLAERERLQADEDIEHGLAQARAGRVGALDELLALVERYPQQFSCARIDHLWAAAEAFARGGERQQAMALYRSAIPACQPADNRIATLYMAQQALGTDSAEVAQLMLAEQNGGQRDEASETKFQRLVYDRLLSQLAAADPASDSARQAIAPIAEAVRAYQDGAAATLIGWVLLAHQELSDAALWFNRAQQWQPGNVDAQLGLLQIRLAAGDIKSAEALLANPALAADPRARAQRPRLQLLLADQLNRGKDYQASLAALDEAQRLGAKPEQTAPMRAWNLYQLGRYAQAETLFAGQYRAAPEGARDPAMAEGWALAASAQGKLLQLAATPEARQAPLADYVMAMQSQQLYYRKQFNAAHTLQQRTLADLAQQPDGEMMRESIARYLPTGLEGIDAASVTAGFTYSYHAGTAGQGRLQSMVPTLAAQWFGGDDRSTRFDLRWRNLMLDAGTITPDGVAQRLGVPTSATGSGRATAQELWFGAGRSQLLDSGNSLDWQLAAGLTDGGQAGTRLHGQGSIGMQTGPASWSLYAGSNPVRDSLLSWRGTPIAGTGQWWGAVRRNAIGARSLVEVAPRWSVSGNAELASYNGHQVQSNGSVTADLGAGYDLKLDGFDYFNVGPALHYLHYKHNQNEYGWGLGGYYSPQRSLSAGLASQFMTPEGRQLQVSGNLEIGYNQSAQSAAACLPAGVPSAYLASAAGISCGYAGSRDSGVYTHAQLAAVKRLNPRWQLGVLGDVNLTPGRDRQYATMLFVRYFFEDRGAVFSRDLPKTTRDFSGQLDDGK